MANRAACSSVSSRWAGDGVNWTVACSGMNGSIPDHATKAETRNVTEITLTLERNKVTVLASAACLFSYKLGSASVALAGPGHVQEELPAVAPPLPAPPAEWVVHATATPGGTAAATGSSAGTGVQHVVDCISATPYGTANIGAEVPLEIIDGINFEYAQWLFLVASSNGPPSQITVCGLNIVATANESVTLTFQTNLGFQSVELIGHDAT